MAKNNPVANESTFLKLKNKIGRKNDKDAVIDTARCATADLVAMSRCIDIISEACACGNYCLHGAGVYATYTCEFPLDSTHPTGIY